MLASQVFRFLLPLFLLNGAFGQFSPLSIAVFPSESTLYVGQMQTFTAVIVGTNDAVIQWAVLEPCGGVITEDGIYTAPESAGIYHVVAVVKNNGQQAQTVVKVSVMPQNNVPPKS